MPDLTAFLLARISEDEAGVRPGTIRNEVFSGIMDHYGLDESDDDDQGEASEISDAIWARLQARVLAECETKRRIIELHHDRTPADIIAEHLEDGETWIPECNECSCYGDCVAELPCPTLRLLTSVYADHADYDEIWRVE